jgi:hypothetical protein
MIVRFLKGDGLPVGFDVTGYKSHYVERQHNQDSGRTVWILRLVIENRLNELPYPTQEAAMEAEREFLSQLLVLKQSAGARNQIVEDAQADSPPVEVLYAPARPDTPGLFGS